MGSDKPIVEFMQSMSHREFITRFQWLENEENNPNRTDYYLMQIAAEMRRSWIKNKNGIKLEKFKIKFGRADAKEPVKMTKEQAAAIEKAKWFAFTGFKPTKDK